MIGIEDGEYALRAGAYPQAFEIFMMLAGTGEDPAYYNLCSMVLNNQLTEDQLGQLVQQHSVNLYRFLQLQHQYR